MAESDREFEEWWDLVWRKVGKGAARKAYAKARKIASHDVLCAAAKAYSSKLAREGTEPKFQPHPVTWLNQERWLDEEAKPVAQKSCNTDLVFNRVKLALVCREVMIDRQDVMLALRAGKITQEEAKRLGI